MLVFIPAVGEFVIPSLLGGPNNLMIGRVLWDEFFGNHDWPVASAVAIAFLLLLAGPIAIYQYYNVRQLESLAWKDALPRLLSTVLLLRHRDPLPADRGADRATPSTPRRW